VVVVICMFMLVILVMVCVFVAVVVLAMLTMGGHLHGQRHHCQKSQTAHFVACVARGAAGIERAPHEGL
jgi:hypothetical protein